MSPVARAAVRLPSLSDAVALTKPRIMMMMLLTAAGGMSLAPGTPRPAAWLALMIGTGLIVGAANTLNMYLERDVDCLMSRTRKRPLPAGRVEPGFALALGVAQAFVAVPILTFAIDPLTGMLGVVALLCYVMLYTPLKQRTTLSTLVGSVPGAMPALMGWTTVTGAVDARGLAVFGVMFLWQVPHFHAIALFRRKDYARAGLKTMPDERGEMATSWRIAVYLVLQVALSLLLYPLGVAGAGYLVVAAVTGAAYLGYGLLGLRPSADPRWGPRWARRLFLASIVYLPILFTAMVLDGRL